MTLVNAGGLIKWPGVTASWAGAIAFATDATLDAAGEYITYVYQAREAMVISHVGQRNGTCSGSPTADVRIETVGTDGIPTGTLWAANTNAISATLVSNTFTLTALTASATIAKSDWFAVKIVYNAGTSLIVSRVLGPRESSLNAPYTVINTTGSPVKTNATGAACIAVGSSTSVFYKLPNTLPMSAVTASTFNNTSGARRAMRFQVPFACRCVGIQFYGSTGVGDFNAILFDDAGTELSSSSTSTEGDRSGNSSGAATPAIFDNAVTLTANTWYRAAIEPSSATNVTTATCTTPDLNYRSGWPGGTNVHYATYVTSTWTDTATDQLLMLDILIDQIHDGASSGGVSSARIFTGM